MCELEMLTPLTIRGLTLPNRCVIPPMCLWVVDPDTPGMANDEHLVHYGSIAESGPGLIIVEATAVQPCGPISPNDLGLWKDDQIAPLKRINDYIHAKTPSKTAIQLAHAGRKGITRDPMGTPIHLTPEDQYGQQCVAPSAIPHNQSMLTPHELTEAEIDQLIADWVSAAKRAVAAGFDAIEIHSAHGYLLHEFVSPISNKRTDKYGGVLENRLRLPLKIVDGVRAVIPTDMPLIIRISCVDWDDAGCQLEDSVAYSTHLLKHGVDVIHCSSGGVSSKQQIHMHTDYQIKFSSEIKRRTGACTIAVGGINTLSHAEEVLRNSDADLIAVGRAYLADPSWLRSQSLVQGVVPWVPMRQSAGLHKTARRIQKEKETAQQAGTQNLQPLQTSS
eukprot:Protomagalhaensia_sp_Gyna_25__531@NODE_124_length_5068_cov_1547_737721_g98_i0_p2_GENE_NODE_124_length_5068_cov_1547_737721_g98_i0NODE_124_length_5068_cov_1547_737721_g98_i0_p2_ORF_typecomplete_len390_score69_01Oxidored_FMN/PF00724_20/3_2e104Dus/PF01207_17/7_7e08IMPDH/PF00478_25/29IMPDH/PF00478_25/0_0024B12binding/PF02310_19/0_0021His_biosynth/PF00977_21/0_081DHO_dh/PF01180_21/2_3CGGC/PF08821_11/0_36_NODE_124_length_5068_cov_1547_737721_g98_i038064975